MLDYHKRPQSLFTLTRGKIPEVAVHGCFYFGAVDSVDRKNIADGDMILVSRSLLKPWQAMAAGFLGKSPSHEDFWALGFASHSGQKMHLEAADSLLKRFGLSEADLSCPKSFPMDAEESSRMRVQGESPRRIYHPCSGKHILMLGGAKSHGFKLQDYAHHEHPLQQKVKSWIDDYSEYKGKWVTDSCGLPSLALPVQRHLYLWNKFARDESQAAVAVKDYWVQKPWLMGGRKRLDSEIVAQFPGKFIAKEAADGILVVQALPQYGGETALVKIWSGYNIKFLGLGLYKGLSAIAKLSPVFSELKEYLSTRITDWIPSDQELE